MTAKEPAFILMLSAIAVSLAPRCPAAAQNLLPNGGFELVGPGAKIADGFSSPDPARLSLDAGHSGRYSQRYDAAVEGDWCEGLDTPVFPVTAGQTYVARVWTKGRDLHIFHIKWRFYDAAGKALVFQDGGSKINYYQFISPVGRLPRGKEWDWDAGLNASPSNERNGSWDWEQWAYVAPPRPRSSPVRCCVALRPYRETTDPYS